ncbi:MAG: hypothetical protein M3Y56_08900, partial [Armatimonadota bacterium]|nr:hypothetical protein [Armatimonadota bacterium]
SRVGYLFGYVCLWSGNQAIGEYSETVILTTSAMFFDAFLEIQGQRSDSIFEGMVPELALRTIRDALFDGDCQTLEEAYDLAERFHKFCLCPGGGEAFDGFFAALIEYPGRTCLVWESWRSSSVQINNLAPGECEIALRQFVDWFNSLRN